MDSFHEPFPRLSDDVSLPDVAAQVRALENEHRENGFPISGRVIHVCHYLPVTATLTNRSGVLSPPPTPPTKPTDVFPSSVDPDPLSPLSQHHGGTWALSSRYGHAALISGIRSLAATHEQLLVGWTGDIQSSTPGENIPTDLISEEDKAALETALRTYQPREADPDDDKKTLYIPVWLDDKVAHGHYDSYCKQSKYHVPFMCFYFFFVHRFVIDFECPMLSPSIPHYHIFEHPPHILLCIPRSKPTDGSSKSRYAPLRGCRASVMILRGRCSKDFSVWIERYPFRLVTNNSEFFLLLIL
jgi:hypothetical protein